MWVGRSILRREDTALLRGEATFIDDLNPFVGAGEAAILRGSYAHARIARLDTSRARALRGVFAVITGTDIAEVIDPIPNALRLPIPYYPIAIDRVRFVGEPVAIAIAVDRYVAEDALDLIETEYEELSVVSDLNAAMNPDCAPIHEKAGSNIIHKRKFKFGDPETAFAQADHVVTVNVDYPRVMSTPIETFGVIANYLPAGGRYTIWSNFQGPFIGHPIIAAALRTKSSHVRMLSAPASGGSFGVKWGVFSYAILVAAAARLAGMPVKWIEDRAEHLAASSSSTGRQSRFEGAFAENGRLLGLRVRQIENVGAYLRPPEPSTLYRTHGNLNGPYDVRNIAVENVVALTNQAPSGLNRGFGAPQYVFPLERLMHEAAQKLGLDPYDIRRKNLVGTADMPYQCVSGAMLDGGDYPATLAQAAGLINYEQLVRDRDAARTRGELAGIGISVSIESSASSLAYVNAALTSEDRANSPDKSGGLATATLSADAGGQFILRLPTVPAGQGHETVLAQIVADELGLQPDDVEVITQIDTGLSDWSITSGNYANRFSGADSTAAVLAARKVGAKLRRMAAAALSCDPADIDLKDGYAQVRGRNSSMRLKQLAAWSHWNSSNMPDGLDGGIQEVGIFTPTTLQSPDKEDRVRASLTTTLMCDIAAVRVDRETGQLKIDKYAIVHDAGRILNPALIEGQVRGGFAHGLGAALLERQLYDDRGNLLSGTFADYLCPIAGDMPKLEIGHAEHPTDQNATGARGMGDGSSMNTPACIANAIADALGSENISIPAGPSRLWSMINGLTPDAHLSAPSVGSGEAGANSPGMIRGEGEQKLPGTPEMVWRALLAADNMAKIIPGCSELKEVEPDRFEARIVISIAGMRATYNAKLALSDKIEPHSVRISGHAEGALGFGAGDAQIRLTPSGDDATVLSYRYNANVGGRIASVGHRMLDSVVGLLISQFFSGLYSHLCPDAPQRGLIARLWSRTIGRIRRDQSS